MRIQVDRSKMLARWQALRKNAAPAGFLAAAHGAHVFTDAIERLAPRDTNRYVRGWQVATDEAARRVGAPGRAVLTVKPSRRHADYVNALAGQVKNIKAEIDWRKKRLQRWYSDRGRATSGGWAQKEMARIASRERRLAKAVEQLAKATEDPTILYFGGMAANPGPLHRDARRQLATVRNKVYGGEGRIMAAGDGRIVVSLTNKEPHSRILEKNLGLRKKAALAARTVGARAVRQAFVRKLMQGRV